MNTNPPLVRSIDVVAASDALLVSWARRSKFSSPVSNIRLPAVGVSIHSLIAVSWAQSGLQVQENSHHTA
jgi:hypothetical protein